MILLWFHNFKVPPSLLALRFPPPSTFSKRSMLLTAILITAGALWETGDRGTHALNPVFCCLLFGCHYSDEDEWFIFVHACPSESWPMANNIHLFITKHVLFIIIYNVHPWCNVGCDVSYIISTDLEHTHIDGCDHREIHVQCFCKRGVTILLISQKI